VHPLLAAAAERQLGLVTAVDARRAGYGHPEIARLCASGRWQRLRRGVYISADDLARAEQRGHRHVLESLAVLLSLDRPTATLSHATAAHLSGLPYRRTRDAAIRLTDPARNSQGRGFRMTRSPLAATEIPVRGPLRVTSVARTLIDCAREEPLVDSVIAMDGALLAERVTRRELEVAIDRADGWPGVLRARRALSLADGRAESPLETRGRLRIVGAGLPVPELRVEITTAGRLVGVVDAWYEEAAVAIECDGQVTYTDPWRGRTPERVLWDEKRREDELRALDIRVVRVAEPDVWSLWPRTEAAIRRLLATPGPAVRRFTATPRTRGILRVG
jgi:hypothetical protein